MSAEPWQGLLERYLEPFRNHTPEWRALFRGSYGPAKLRLVPELEWNGVSWPGPLADWLALPRPEFVPVTRVAPCPAWKRPRPVLFLRPGHEAERLSLLDCEGGVSVDALERLSVLSRPPGTRRPELPLPIEPLSNDGEWVPEVRLLSPRLIWAVARLAESFPNQAIEIVSGYRRSGHDTHHAKGLALDLAVRGVAKEAVFAACRRLRDVGCGYYPESPFVHIDVREFGSGHVAWVDASLPGETSRYVDGWPGVLRPRTSSELGHAVIDSGWAPAAPTL